MKINAISLALCILVILNACGTSPINTPSPNGSLKILAAESFLADITRNIVSELVSVDSLIPQGLDPHAYEPTPEDVVKIAKSHIMIVNGGGLEEAWLQKTIENAGSDITIIEASAGIKFRQAQPGEASGDSTNETHQNGAGDPHFWLDPNLVIRYVENIRDSISRLDPMHREAYQVNANKYIQDLLQLDSWIKAEVAQIPPEQRMLVTNHESLGYFADRYGFRIIGSIIPSYSSLASPSANQITSLVDQIRKSGVKAIFLETGSNPALAAQIARETGVTLVDTLNDHSLTDSQGPVPNYIEMIHYNVQIIVDALK